MAKPMGRTVSFRCGFIVYRAVESCFEASSPKKLVWPCSDLKGIRAPIPSDPGWRAGMLANSLSSQPIATLLCDKQPSCCGIGFDLLAQPIDMCLQGVRRYAGIVAPNFM